MHHFGVKSRFYWNQFNAINQTSCR